MFTEYVQMVAESRTEKRRKKPLKELDKSPPESKFPNPVRYVHNFSTVDITDTQLQVLSLGPKFCDAISFDKQLDVKSQFENLSSQTSILQPISEKESENFKSILVNICVKFRIKESSVVITDSHSEI